ncbi:MAG TPA: permease prefix domain 1-containing protein, partial [Herpetosiphonaceae bacterium]
PYITPLNTRLRSLPQAQREDDLREVRQHLEALVAGHVMRGMSEADAIDAALRQFGRAEQIGKDLATIQQPNRPLWHYLLMYAGCVLVIFVFFATANDKPTDFPYGWADQLLLALVLPAGILIATIKACIRAIRASRAGM